MKFVKLKNTIISIIIVNIIVLISLLISNSKITDLIVFFWIESVIIWIFIMIKYCIIGEKKHLPMRIFVCLLITTFFIYGDIEVIDTILGLFESSPTLNLSNTNMNSYLFIFSIILLFGSHLYSFISNFLMKKEYKKTSPQSVIFTGTVREIYLLIFMILAVFIVGSLDIGQASLILFKIKSDFVNLSEYINYILLIIFIIIKIFADILLHVNEHSKEEINKIKRIK